MVSVSYSFLQVQVVVKSAFRALEQVDEEVDFEVDFEQSADEDQAEENDESEDGDGDGDDAATPAVAEDGSGGDDADRAAVRGENDMGEADEAAAVGGEIIDLNDSKGDGGEEGGEAPQCQKGDVRGETTQVEVHARRAAAVELGQCSYRELQGRAKVVGINPGQKKVGTCVSSSLLVSPCCFLYEYVQA